MRRPPRQLPALASLRRLRGRNRQKPVRGPGGAQASGAAFAGEESKLIRTLGLLQILLLVSTLTVAVNYDSAEQALQAYEEAALRGALDMPAPPDFSIQLNLGADSPVQKLRLKGTRTGGMSVRRAVGLLAANGARLGLDEAVLRNFTFDVRDAALGVGIHYTASTVARDVWTFDGPRDPAPKWTAKCAPSSEIQLVSLDKAGKESESTPIIEMSFRIFLRAELTRASSLARPDLASSLSMRNTSLAESVSRAQALEQLKLTAPSIADMPAKDLASISSPCAMMDLSGFPLASTVVPLDERLDLAQALGRWKGSTASVQTDYAKLRDSRMSQEVKVPLIDVSVPARGFAWAVMILTLYVGVTLSRLARALESAGHPTVTTVARILQSSSPGTSSPTAGRGDAFVMRLERAFPWLNALIVALAPLIIVVASAALWAPIRQTVDWAASTGGRSQVTFLPVSYTVPYLLLLLLSALVSWVSITALWRERWGLNNKHGDADAAAPTGNRLLRPLRKLAAFLASRHIPSVLAMNAALGAIALTFYGDVALEESLHGKFAMSSDVPLLIPKLVLAGLITLVALISLGLRRWHRLALALQGLALMGAWAWGLHIGLFYLTQGRPPAEMGPPWSNFTWGLGVTSFLGAYGTWLVTHSLHPAVSGRASLWLRRAPFLVFLLTLPLDMAVLLNMWR